ncbi:MAG: glycosyltransferase, partial [candidate division Zixibacteria bacterium]|nr:glycosyltransferase [candidate division Zixibacteria bacterium]
IVCLAEDWGRLPSSSQHIMRVLSKEYPILWVDSLGLRTPSLNKTDLKRIFTKFYKFLSGINEVEPNIYIYSPVVLPFFQNSLARKINQIIVTFTLKYFLYRKKARVDLLWVACPSAESIVGWLNERKSIYYCADEYSQFSGYSKVLVKELEEKVLKKVDSVLVVSEKLYQSKKELNSNIFLIPHGVEFNHFSKYNLSPVDLPPELNKIKKPVIGYYGLIRDWIDFELLKEISHRKDWSLVLIGPVNTDTSIIRGLDNVHLLGPKDYKSLPLYLQGFDVCIIPYKLMEVTINARPLKLFEYMASGKPVVSTPLPAVLPYKEVVGIGYTNAGFVKQIEKSLEEKDNMFVQKRVDLARENSWENLVERSLKNLLFN